MSRRKTWIGFTIGFCVSAMLAGLLALSRLKQPDVQLIFVGYTNEVFEFVLERNADRYTGWMTKAIFAVTNCGSVPVEIAPITKAYPVPQIPSRVHSYLLMPAVILEPGESELAITLIPAKEDCWRMDVAYTRLDLVERLTDKARRARSFVVRSTANRLHPSAKLCWARSGWITNSTSSVNVSRYHRYHITAPPPDVFIELTPGPKRQ